MAMICLVLIPQYHHFYITTSQIVFSKTCLLNDKDHIQLCLEILFVLVFSPDMCSWYKERNIKPFNGSTFLLQGEQTTTFYRQVNLNYCVVRNCYPAY